MSNIEELSLSPDTPSTGEAPALPEPTQKGEAAEISAGLSASRKPAIIAAVVAVVVLAVLIIVGVILFNHPAAAAKLRDIFIIFLGFLTMIVGLLVVVAVVAIIYVALKVYDFVQFVQDELGPMLERADDAARTVQSRAVFISDAAVKPVIEVMAYVSALKSVVKSFTRSRN